jgi:hypothetical protein
LKELGSVETAAFLALLGGDKPVATPPRTFSPATALLLGRCGYQGGKLIAPSIVLPDEVDTGRSA